MVGLAKVVDLKRWSVIGFALRSRARLLALTTANPGSPFASIKLDDDGLGRDTPTTSPVDESTLMPIGRWPKDRTLLARIGSAGLPRTGGGDISSSGLYVGLGARRTSVTSTNPPSSLELSSLLISTTSAARARVLWRDLDSVVPPDLSGETGLLRD